MHPVFPFSAIVGQDDIKLALKIAAVDPTVGGVLIFGDRGTGKSTAVRGLAALLPSMKAVKRCPYACMPERPAGLCDACGFKTESGKFPAHQTQVPVVDLPLGATEDRIVGSLDLEKALTKGEKAFEPGLLARANRGFLYIDEVNLLEDHLVDLLLDVAASGENLMEREGLSIRHPARFVLIGSGNPEEGELRPQLLDRFGLAVDVTTPEDIETRVQVLRRRDSFERDSTAFLSDWQEDEEKVRKQIVSAKRRLDGMRVADEIYETASRLCLALGTDGMRGELTLLRAARAAAALTTKRTVSVDHLRQVAAMSLQHRLRRDPLDEAGSVVRVQRAVDEVLGP